MKLSHLKLALLTALLMPGIIFGAAIETQVAPKSITLKKSSAQDVSSGKVPGSGKDFVEMHEREALSQDTFGEMLAANYKEQTPLIIARVTTNGSVYHYFPVHAILHHIFGDNIKRNFMYLSRFRAPGPVIGKVYDESFNTLRDVYNPPIPPIYNTDPLNKSEIQGTIPFYIAYGTPEEVQEFAYIGDDKITTDTPLLDDPNSFFASLMRALIATYGQWDTYDKGTKEYVAPKLLYGIGDLFRQPFVKNLPQALDYYKKARAMMIAKGETLIQRYTGIDPVKKMLVQEIIDISALEKTIKEIESQLATTTPAPPLPGALLWDKKLANLWATLKELLNKKEYKQELQQGKTWFDLLNQQDWDSIPVIREQIYKVNPAFDEFLGAKEKPELGLLNEFSKLTLAVDRANLIAALDYILPFVFGTGKFNAEQEKKLNEILDIIGRDKPTGKKIEELVKKRGQAPKVPARPGASTTTTSQASN